MSGRSPSFTKGWRYRVLANAVLEEFHGDIEFRVVNNDNSRESTIILTGLKNIFQKQLPKMPRDYIARLVYDRTHLSMAIVKRPLEVVGYVCRDTLYLHIYYTNQWSFVLTLGVIEASHIGLSRADNSQKLCFVPFRRTNKSGAMVPISCLIWRWFSVSSSK